MSAALIGWLIAGLLVAGAYEVRILRPGGRARDAWRMLRDPFYVLVLVIMWPMAAAVITLDWWVIRARRLRTV